MLYEVITVTAFLHADTEAQRFLRPWLSEDHVERTRFVGAVIGNALGITFVIKLVFGQFSCTHKPSPFFENLSFWLAPIICNWGVLDFLLKVKIMLHHREKHLDIPTFAVNANIFLVDWGNPGEKDSQPLAFDLVKFYPRR